MFADGKYVVVMQTGGQMVPEDQKTGAKQRRAKLLVDEDVQFRGVAAASCWAGRREPSAAAARHGGPSLPLGCARPAAQTPADRTERGTGRSGRGRIFQRMRDSRLLLSLLAEHLHAHATLMTFSCTQHVL